MPRISPIRALVLVAGLGVGVWQSPRIAQVAAEMRHPREVGQAQALALSDEVDHQRLIAALRAATAPIQKETAPARLFTAQGGRMTDDQRRSLAQEASRSVPGFPGLDLLLLEAAGNEDPSSAYGSDDGPGRAEPSGGSDADSSLHIARAGGGDVPAPVGAGDADQPSDEAGEVGGLPGIDLAAVLGTERVASERPAGPRPGAFHLAGVAPRAADRVAPPRRAGRGAVVSYSTAERRTWRFKPFAIIGPPGSAPDDGPVVPQGDLDPGASPSAAGEHPVRDRSGRS